MYLRSIKGFLIENIALATERREGEREREREELKIRTRYVNYATMERWKIQLKLIEKCRTHGSIAINLSWNAYESRT